MKFRLVLQEGHPVAVTPFTGVWIEIVAVLGKFEKGGVSHPSRVCGLKCL